MFRVCSHTAVLVEPTCYMFLAMKVHKKNEKEREREMILIQFCLPSTITTYLTTTQPTVTLQSFFSARWVISIFLSYHLHSSHNVAL